MWKYKIDWNFLCWFFFLEKNYSGMQVVDKLMNGKIPFSFSFYIF
jgi:hypothetical protein